jgi:hypothetical protein
MTTIRDWQTDRDMWVRVLERQTGAGFEVWNKRIRKQGLESESTVRTWLRKQGVSGYAQSLLVMERFGYPDFIRATGQELIDGQYADRPQLRPIYDAIIDTATKAGEVAIQARKTFVALVSPWRTFARVQPTTRNRVDVGLRLEGQKPAGRLRPSRIHETMQLQMELTSAKEVDFEVRHWLEKAYTENS